MRFPSGVLLACLQVAPLPAQEMPPQVSLKWHGALWASGAASDQLTADGSLFLRNVDAGEGRLALDGLAWGAEVALPEGWSLRFTLLAGRTAQVLNDASGEKGAISYPEAMLVWTGKQDVLRFGRMYTFMGMEFLDQTLNSTASRGLLFTYAIPFNQVGLAWRHTFTSAWSTDLWLFNGENRVQDNNRGKTVGLGLNYNHGGSAEKYVSLMAYRGAEQDTFGAAENSGGEGRKRTRLCALVGWTWGDLSLLGEVEAAQETFPSGAISGAPAGETEGRWSGGGLIFKRKFNERWSGFLRAEVMKDDRGLSLSYDPTVASAWGSTYGADLRASSYCVGAERRWGATYTRLEARRDQLNKDVLDPHQKPFRGATSLTWSLGTSF